MIRDRRQLAFESTEAIAAVADELLAQHAAYCYEHSPHYRRLFEKLNLGPADIAGVEDLPRLPITHKSDLEQCGDDFLCTPTEPIVDVCQTSGSMGEPVSLYQTAADLERVGYNEQLGFIAAGVTASDRVLIACAMGRCFMAGLAYFEGVRRIGAMAIRAGSGALSVVAQSVRTHRPTVIIAVPSQLLTLADALDEQGLPPKTAGVRTLICIGEPIRNDDLSLSPLGERLTARWGCDVRGTYASTEMATAFTDCQAGRGGHLIPDLMAVEIVDSHGRPCPPGSPGRVIATPLQVTGMPLLRFCTGDIAALHTDPCPCGRNTPRLGPILGRLGQLLKIRGTSVYPEAVFAALREFEGIVDYYLEIHDDFELSDRACLTVALADEKDKGLDCRRIAERIRGRTRVTLEVKAAPAAEVAARVHRPDRRKPRRVMDYRTSNPKLVE